MLQQLILAKDETNKKTNKTYKQIDTRMSLNDIQKNISTFTLQYMTNRGKY